MSRHLAATGDKRFDALAEHRKTQHSATSATSAIVDPITIQVRLIADTEPSLGHVVARAYSEHEVWQSLEADAIVPRLAPLHAHSHSQSARTKEGVRAVTRSNTG
ncbi:hypothetical protein BC830DRAFT_1079405 [Chytriomyces sp. MP71]|nr:hypothetical protein BC830DRAFT_1079405 [Chytriomyces sp. MP71]